MSTKDTIIAQVIIGQLMVFIILVNDSKSRLLIIHITRIPVTTTLARITLDLLMALLSLLQNLAIFINILRTLDTFSNLPLLYIAWNNCGIFQYY
jgi:hypothetical protein|tara:strand:+ start:62 stop:346 length:285 start_codon:yes stop_codon:yes gene_type:complete